MSDGIQRRKGGIVLDPASSQPKTSPRGFFHCRVLPFGRISAAEVRDWQTYLEGEHLSAGSVYNRISKLSRFL